MPEHYSYSMHEHYSSTETYDSNIRPPPPHNNNNNNNNNNHHHHHQEENSNNATVTKNNHNKKVLLDQISKSKINFIHIPKAGGTTFEYLSRQHNHRCGLWGSRLVGSRALAKEHPWASGYWHKKVQYRNRTCSCAEWHMPPSLLIQNQELLVLRKMYPARETFCVMREPLDRLISIYYYHFKSPQPIKSKKTTKNHPRKNKTKPKPTERKYQRGPCYDNTAKEMNRNLEYILNTALTSQPCMFGCHLLPQSLFIQTDPTDPNQAYNCQHVLLLRNNNNNNSNAEDTTLERKFNKFMEQRNCPIRFPDEPKRRLKNVANQQCENSRKFYLDNHENNTNNTMMMGKNYTKWTVKDLSPEVRRLAEKLFEDDIELYNRLLSSEEKLMDKKTTHTQHTVQVSPCTEMILN